MEILTLILLYCLSQNPDFPESVKPLMSGLKNSEQMLGFLNELSRFTQTFSTFQACASKKETENPQTSASPGKGQSDDKKTPPDDKKTPQSPTSGIADAFIQQMLESYLKKH